MLLNTLLLSVVLAGGDVSAGSAERVLPARRSVMTLLVEHRTQFPEMVEKIAHTGGGVNVAAPICFNPGHMSPTTNLSSPFCLDDFLVPMRQRMPTITQHPMIQMANEVLLYNLKHYGWTVKAFKQVAMQYDDLIDGFLFYPQLAAKVGGTGDYKALLTMLNLFADELHSINKTLGVFTPDYHSKFSPAAVLEGSRIDYCEAAPTALSVCLSVCLSVRLSVYLSDPLRWANTTDINATGPCLIAGLTNLEVKTCAEVGAFYHALKGHNLIGKGGGTLFTSDGAFNSAGCMDLLFAPASGAHNLTNHSTGTGGGALVETQASAIGFYTDFSSMGDVWWPALRSWLAGTR